MTTNRRPPNPRLVPPGKVPGMLGTRNLVVINQARTAHQMVRHVDSTLSTGGSIGAKRHIERTVDTTVSHAPNQGPAPCPHGHAPREVALCPKHAQDLLRRVSNERQVLRDMITSSLDLLIEMHGLTFVLQCLADVSNERCCELELDGNTVEAGSWRRVTSAIQSAKSRAKGDRL